MDHKNRPAWVKDKNVAEDFEVISCKLHDPYKDYASDLGCYVLIRIYRENNEIGVAICDYKHVILKEFRGMKCQDVYSEIFNYSKKNNLKWFTEFQHAAYLGKELKKAEMCLVMGCDY